MAAPLAMICFLLLCSCPTVSQGAASWLSHDRDRVPFIPDPAATTELRVRIGYDGWVDTAVIYYTTDGSEPLGSFGAGTDTTQVSPMAWDHNDPNDGMGEPAWYIGTLPALPKGTLIRYRIGSWHSGGGDEVFADNAATAAGTADEWHVRVAAPPWPGVGYPAIRFWKEEGVVGNNNMNVMIDRNGSVYDIYYPTVGNHNGVACENEGYDGPQEHPPGTTGRGQMNLGMATVGLMVDGTIHWMTNDSPYPYQNVTQSYVADTNVIRTESDLDTAGADLHIQQYDFCPKDISYPTTAGSDEIRGIYVKRLFLRNDAGTAETFYVYFNADFNVNGNNMYDRMDYDLEHEAMIAWDNTQRNTSFSGEWNPRSFGSGYDKNVSLFFGVAGKVCDSTGGASGRPPDGNWRMQSDDDHQGWIGFELTVGPGETKEIDFAVIGAFEPGFATGTWDYWGGPGADWFYANSMADAQTATETAWRDWLAEGTTIDTPDDMYDELFRRGLLASSLHWDEVFGCIIAGMHNGAYPYVWPRDCVYAAVSLDRTGHRTEAAEVYRWLREIAYVNTTTEPWGRAFFYQKYTTDGHHIWNSPQVDETACVPWGVYFHYLCEGDPAFLSDNWTMVHDAAIASSTDSRLDSRLYYDDPFDLVHGNNIWEDRWDDFLYSNATVVRGLRDAARIAAVLGDTTDVPYFDLMAGRILSGMDGRLAWGGFNTDVSLLGLSVPFEVYPADDPRMLQLRTRILTDLAEPGDDTIWRYQGDTYWGGGPWWLATLWTGIYEAELQDRATGKEFVDLLKTRIDAVIEKRGPIGLGSEQIAPSWGQLYPDFDLQTAWPNVWESMSTLVDAIMMLLDFEPDAPAGSFRIEPKLPSGWSAMTFSNLRVGGHAFNVTVTESPGAVEAAFTHVTGGALEFNAVLRRPVDAGLTSVTVDGIPTAYVYDSTTGRVEVAGSLSTAAGGTTLVRVEYQGATSTPHWLWY